LITPHYLIYLRPSWVSINNNLNQFICEAPLSINTSGNFTVTNFTSGLWFSLEENRVTVIFNLDPEWVPVDELTQIGIIQDSYLTLPTPNSDLQLYSMYYFSFREWPSRNYLYKLYRNNFENIVSYYPVIAMIGNMKNSLEIFDTHVTNWTNVLGITMAQLNGFIHLKNYTYEDSILSVNNNYNIAFDYNLMVLVDDLTYRNLTYPVDFTPSLRILSMGMNNTITNFMMKDVMMTSDPAIRIEGTSSEIKVINATFDNVKMKEYNYLIRVDHATSFQIDNIQYKNIHGYEPHYFYSSLIYIVVLDLISTLDSQISNHHVENSTIGFLTLGSVANSATVQKTINISNITYSDSFFENKK
jgi:hypothetical protein